MNAPVEPSHDLGVEMPAADVEQYRLAVEEARTQAEALRHAVNRANDLVRQLEEMVESLRAILVYPKAYDWPLAEPTTDEGLEGGSGNVIEVQDLGGPLDRAARPSAT
ncbi:MAG TPA: hypothetical protein VFZ96_00320 [Actinomycetota bacterium]|nr:hypothetical protein [Actinomycetota bacterium]